MPPSRKDFALNHLFFSRRSLGRSWRPPSRTSRATFRSDSAVSWIKKSCRSSASLRRETASRTVDVQSHTGMQRCTCSNSQYSLSHLHICLITLCVGRCDKRVAVYRHLTPTPTPTPRPTPTIRKLNSWDITYLMRTQYNHSHL